MDNPGPDGHGRGKRRDRAVRLIGWSLLAAVLLLGALAVLLYLSV
jgi:hypothetical protein